MIHVARIPKPSILVRKEAQWKAQIRHASTPSARKQAQDKYQHQEVKDALITMFHGKCAYCESAITHIDYGHIEHFRPKSHPAFYEKAVEWDNLLLACGRCNGAENKGVCFPSASQGGPLLNPTQDDDPEQHLKFDFDPVTKLANVLDRTSRGRTTWQTLGLNRTELLRRRSEFVKKLSVVANFYGSHQEARAIIDEAIQDSSEYVAFARAIRSAAISQSTVGMP